MGQSIYTQVVAGAEWSILHQRRKKVVEEVRYDEVTGESRLKKFSSYPHFISGVEYTDAQYGKYEYELGEQGLELFIADSGDDEVIIGKELEGERFHPDPKGSEMVQSIDLEAARKLIEEVKPLLAKLGVPPEQVKLYSIAHWSY